MGRNIEVSVEAFGNRRLTAVLTPEQLKGKSVETVVREMVARDWQGEDRITLEAIKKQLEGSGGYTPEVGVGGLTSPIKFQPVRLGEGVERYVQDFGLPEDQLRVAVIADNRVGYQH